MPSRAFPFKDGKVELRGVTWLRSQGGAGLESSPLDFVYNCCFSAVAYLLTYIIVTQDADHVSLTKCLVMFRILCSKKIKEVSNML